MPRSAGAAAGTSGASGERIATPPVDRPHPTQVSIKVPSIEEVSECQLLEDGRTAIHGSLRVGDLVDVSRRDDEPAETQSGRQGLARRASVEDVLGRQALDRPDRFPVVSILGVVVVLNDQPIAVHRPGFERRPPFRSQNDAGRKVMGRRHDHGVDPASLQGRDIDPGLVHGDRDDLQAGMSDRLGQVTLTRIFDRDPSCAVVPSGPAPPGPGPERSRCRSRFAGRLRPYPGHG